MPLLSAVGNKLQKKFKISIIVQSWLAEYKTNTSSVDQERAEVGCGGGT